MKPQNIIFLILGTLLIVSLACSFDGLTPSAPTSLPDPIVTTPPQLPPATSPPAETQSPTEPSLVPYRPQAAIFIQSPGLGSQVTSPVTVVGFSEPTFEQTLVVTITDVNSTILVTQPVTIQADVGQAGPFNLTLDFYVSTDRPGRITVSDISARDGGVVNLASVPVTLLAAGVSNITAAGPSQAAIIIYSPTFLEEISGGVLEVSGYSRYFFEANLSVTLCGSWAGGGPHPICGTIDNVIAESYATIQSPDMGIPGPFSGAIAYNTVPGTRARLVVWAQSMMDGGIEDLTSVMVILQP